MEQLRDYIRSFNASDEETVRQYVDNAHAEDFILENFPRLSCPDKTIEKTFAFRCWTLRKHIKQTEDGFVFTEFLPQVPWSGKHNTINAALAHHLNEIRWMKDSTYGMSYLSFFLEERGSSYTYYTPALTEMGNYLFVTGNEAYALSHAEQLERYLQVFDNRHRLENGLYWSIDNYDAMEFSISGTCPDGTVQKGIRPTLNAYMYGGFCTLAALFEKTGDKQKSETYKKRAEALKKAFFAACRDGHFFKAVHLPETQLHGAVSFRELPPECNVKEEIGLIPFRYGLFEPGDEEAFREVLEGGCLHSPYGILTADKTHPRYLYAHEHECLWNGYIWPFATSQTISSLISLLETMPQHDAVTNETLYRLILEYSRMHTMTENGRTVPWIDEVMSPVNGSWYARDVLRELGWKPELGGYERGKDYNHSTYLDLVIRGLIGVREDTPELTVQPRIEGIWDWFRLENLPYRGKVYHIFYDADGSHFGKGAGIHTEIQ